MIDSLGGNSRTVTDYTETVKTMGSQAQQFREGQGSIQNLAGDAGGQLLTAGLNVGLGGVVPGANPEQLAGLAKRTPGNLKQLMEIIPAGGRLITRGGPLKAAKHLLYAIFKAPGTILKEQYKLEKLRTAHAGSKDFPAIEERAVKEFKAKTQRAYRALMPNNLRWAKGAIMASIVVAPVALFILCQFVPGGQAVGIVFGIAAVSVGLAILADTIVEYDPVLKQQADLQAGVAQEEIDEFAAERKGTESRRQVEEEEVEQGQVKMPESEPKVLSDAMLGELLFEEQASGKESEELSDELLTQFLMDESASRSVKAHSKQERTEALTKAAMGTAKHSEEMQKKASENGRSVQEETHAVIEDLGDLLFS